MREQHAPTPDGEDLSLAGAFAPAGQGYRIVGEQEVEIQREDQPYGKILRRLTLMFDSVRHQLVVADDIDEASQRLTRHLLTFDRFETQSDSALRRLTRGVSLSPTEVVDGKMNASRLIDRQSKSVVQVNLASPEVLSFLERVWKQAYDFVPQTTAAYKLCNPFGDPTLGPQVIRAFEEHAQEIVFVNRLSPSMDPGELAAFTEALSKTLYEEKRYGFDHGDYRVKIPNTVWVVPPQLYLGVVDSLLFKMKIATYEFPDISIMLERPFATWPSKLDPFYDQEQLLDSDSETSRMKRYQNYKIYDALDLVREALGDCSVESAARYRVSAEDLEFIRSYSSPE